LVGQFKQSKQRATITTLPVTTKSHLAEQAIPIQNDWKAAGAWFLDNAKREGQSPLSVRTREQRLHLFIWWAQAKGLDPIDVKQAHVKNYIDQCLADGVSHFTVNGRLRVLKTFYTEGIRDGYFLLNPATGVRKLKEATNTVVPLTTQQVTALLGVFNRSDWVELRDATIITLLLDTGLRIQEALQARVQDLRLEDNALFIPPEHAKGAKARTVYFGRKTGEIIKTWLDKRGVDTAILFPSVYVDASGNYESLTTRAFAKRLTKYGEKAKITHIHPHMLRHTFAVSYLVNSGGDLVTCSRQMGHSDIKTTERYLNVAATEAQRTLVQQHSLVDRATPTSKTKTRVRRSLT